MRIASATKFWQTFTALPFTDPQDYVVYKDSTCISDRSPEEHESNLLAELCRLYGVDLYFNVRIHGSSTAGG